MLRLLSAVIIVLSICFFVSNPASAEDLWPDQPAEGPGGTEYLYHYVGDNGNPESYGIGVNKYYIYEPSASSNDLVSVGEPLPVIAFLHGYYPFPDTLNPYEAFIHHLVKKGYIVIYPIYQNVFSLSDNYVINAGTAISSALGKLVNTPKRDPATNEILFGLIGHSFGGVTAANLAVVCKDVNNEYGLPSVRALMLMDATAGSNRNLTKFWLTEPIGTNTNLVIVLGEEDDLAATHDYTGAVFEEGTEDPGLTDSGTIFNNSEFTNKTWIFLKSDEYNGSSLPADHLAPCSIDKTMNTMESVFNSLDYYGFWKWTTALMEYTFYSDSDAWDYIYGDETLITDMGQWENDGRAVTPPEVHSEPYWVYSSTE